MELTLERIEHGKYGKIENFVFELPLFLATGKVPEPPILSNQVQIDRILQNHLSLVRKMHEEEDDETILEKMHTVLVHTAFMDGTLVPESAEHLLAFKSAFGGSAGRYVDELSAIGEDYEVEVGYKHYVKRLSLIESFIENRGSEEEIERLRPLIPIPTLVNQLSFGNTAARQAEADIPDIWEKLAESHRMGVLSGAAMAMSFDTDDFAEETVEEIQALSTSQIPIIEMLAGFRNLKIDPRIRESFLFQRILNRYNLVTRALLNIVMLEEDTENERDRYNTILRLAKTAPEVPSQLHSSIETMVIKIRRMLHDMKMMINKLEKTHVLDENLSEYLEIVQNCWDAQLLMMVHSTEFKHLKPRLTNKLSQ